MHNDEIDRQIIDWEVTEYVNVIEEKMCVWLIHTKTQVMNECQN